MSREEKEKLLNEKMENIRKRNEELRKRHEEIEADKKNADKFSSTVTMDKVKPYVMKSPRTRPEKSERPRESANQPSVPRPSDIMPSRQRLSENDGPPPDPSYRFLSDPDRDGGDREKKRDGRGKRKGKHSFKGEGEEGQEEDRGKVDLEGDGLEFSEGIPSGGHGNDNGRGKTKFDIANGEQKHGWGRGRGRSRGGHDRGSQDYEFGHPEDNSTSGSGEGEGGKRKGRGNKPSFASRDIRYYPQDDDYQRVGKEGRPRGRGRQNYNQWNYSDEGQNKGHRQGSFEHRGRGRGRNRDKQREYERWKAERAAIDEARLTRGKTDGGSWRREWDNDKMSQGEVEDTEAVYDPRFPRSKSEKFKLADLINLSDKEGSDQHSGKHQDGIHRERRFGSGRGSREKFVKVDTDQVNKIPLQGHDGVKQLESKLDHDTTSRYTDGDSNQVNEVLAYADEKQDLENIPAQAPASVPEDVEDIPLPDQMESSIKEITSKEVIEEFCDDSYQKIEEGAETDCQSGAADSANVTGDILEASSHTLADADVVADSNTIVDGELNADEITVKCN